MNGSDLTAAFGLANDITGKREHPLRDTALSHQAAAEVAYLLQELNLPVPREGQYLSSNDGALLFLNDYGCVVRIENTGVAPDPVFSDNPFLLQPMGRINGQYVTIEICGGGTPTGNQGHIFRLQDRLAECGLALNDNDLDARNCVLLPYRNDEWPDGVPVVSDRSGVKKDDEYRPAEGAEAAFYAEVQKLLYGDLQDIFEQAWNSRDFSADHGTMIAFWEECRSAAEEGRLVAGWNGESSGKRHPHQDGAVLAAAGYAEALDVSPPETPRFEREPLSRKDLAARLTF